MVHYKGVVEIRAHTLNSIVMQNFHKISMAKVLCTEESAWCKTNQAQEFHITLKDLPTEVLVCILRYFSYHDLATVIRLVCHNLRDVCVYMLNSAFAGLNSKICFDLRQSYNLINPDNSYSKLACVAYDEMETVQSEYGLTMALIWRYVYGPQKFLCMYAGKIIDGVEELLRTDYKDRSNDKVRKIRSSLKHFQDYFENRTERKCNSGWHVSGAKLLDLLNCIEDPFKESYYNVELDSYSPETGIYSMKCKYLIPRCWYTSKDPEKPDSFNKRHRLLSHCIRRLISKHNDYSRISFQRRRQRILFTRPLDRVWSCCYTGFSDLTLTSYGCLNPVAYRKRFPEAAPFPAEDMEGYADEGQEGEEENEDEENGDGGSEEENPTDEESGPDFSMLQPDMDLTFVVGLECPIELAPKRAVEMYRGPVPNSQPRKKTKYGSFYLKIDIISPSSQDSKLPSVFTWLVT